MLSSLGPIGARADKLRYLTSRRGLCHKYKSKSKSEIYNILFLTTA